MPATAYWFCPENDIALASGREIFTPPRQAALLGRYGAPLLWWMGTPDDMVLIPSDLTPEEADSLGQWEMQMKARFGSGPRLLPSLQGEKSTPFARGDGAATQPDVSGARARLLISSTKSAPA